MASRRADGRPDLGEIAAMCAHALNPDTAGVGTGVGASSEAKLGKNN